MSSGYQMTGAVADARGVIVEIGHNGPAVEIRLHARGPAVLNAAQREDFARIFFQAERQAEASA